jgi:hypothetical protein
MLPKLPKLLPLKINLLLELQQQKCQLGTKLLEVRSFLLGATQIRILNSSKKLIKVYSLQKFSQEFRINK